ncbi:MAG: hypothetical protein LBU61_02875 [Coriobacteriales bacterium]|nr:hypothetical protein [Coriobacteriales bacterium]
MLVALLLIIVGCTPKEEAPTPELFPLSDNCVDCHDNISAPDGSSYSFVEDWRQTAHAQAAVDPFFLAVTRSETLIIPEANDLIQSTCAGCHLPMADFSAQASNNSRAFLDNAAQPGHELYQLYAEGDSCMICHQLTEQTVESNISFLGTRLSIDLGLYGPGEYRQLYGYHEISEAGQQSMMESIRYISLQSDAERKSIICNVCHTLYTDSYTIDGQPTGTKLPEQVVFFEWLHSDLVSTACQTCHMPVITEFGPLSNVQIDGGVQGRIGAHTFLGVNSYLLQMNEQLHGPFKKGIHDIEDFLQTQTATLSLEAGLAEGFDGAALLELDVRIDSLVGHKFPTGFPSRRAWLHVTVCDEFGNVVYESGAYDSEGRILDNDGDNIKGSYEPHYDLIDQPGQVQIYEAIMIDSTGSATTNLLQGVYFGKDNRLLPPGFDKVVVSADIDVYGSAKDDPDFIGGSDIVHYRILLSNNSYLVVDVELLFQPISYRFLDNLKDYPSVEQEVLFGLVRQTPNLPTLVVKEQIVINR